MKNLKTLLAAAVTLMMATQLQAGDIVDVAASNKSFKTLVAAVKAAGLVETLKSDGPFTVFAPTDEAFAKSFGTSSFVKASSVNMFIGSNFSVSSEISTVSDT